jgi:hypothetical protein
LESKDAAAAMDTHDHRRLRPAGILRLTSWATAATAALALAALASITPTGSERVNVAIAALTGGDARPATPAVARKGELETDRRSLNEALRLLAADRDRLMTRITSLERNLEDITGSIKNQAARAASADTGLPIPPIPDIPTLNMEEPSSKRSDVPAWMSNQPTPASDAGAPASFPAVPAARVAAAPAEAQPAASRNEFGVDIGSGSTLEDVRVLWNAAKSQYGKLIGNLRPIVVRREDRAGNPDLRLVIGPLANAGAAAKLCATLGAADVMCSTRPYQGERLTP